MHSSSRMCRSMGRVLPASPLFLLASLSGCALEPGDPWGLVLPELEVGLVLPAGRVDDAGRIRTSDDYRVTLDRVRIEVDTLELVAGERGVLSFDPASPPPGYTLCHNGHCHAEDGRLVDYADVEAELAGGSGGAAPLAVVPGQVVELDGPGLVGLSLGGCAVEGCVIDAPVTAALLRARVSSVQLEGRVEDARTGAAARLAPGGVPFDVALAPSTAGEGLVSPAVAVAFRFGPGEDPGLSLVMALTVGPELFDGIPWTESDTTRDAGLLAALGQATSLDVVEASRFDP